MFERVNKLLVGEIPELQESSPEASDADAASEESKKDSADTFVEPSLKDEGIDADYGDEAAEAANEDPYGEEYVSGS